jgi:hypothetical protein
MFPCEHRLMAVLAGLVVAALGVLLQGIVLPV